MNLIIEVIKNVFLVENILSAFYLAAISGILIGIIYKSLSKITPKLHKAQRIDKIITQILDNANKMVMREEKVDIRSCVFYADKKRNKLRLFFTSSDFDGNSPERNISFEKGAGVVGKCWELNEPVIGNIKNKKFEDILDWRISKSQYYKTRNLSAVLAVPIKSSMDESQVIGVFAFDSDQENAYNRFNKEEMVSIAIKHSILVGKTFEKIELV